MTDWGRGPVFLILLFHLHEKALDLGSASIIDSSWWCGDASQKHILPHLIIELAGNWEECGVPPTFKMGSANPNTVTQVRIHPGVSKPHHTASRIRCQFEARWVYS